MSPEHVKLVQQSWHALTSQADLTAKLFYEQLFETDPEARQLFESADLAAQRYKLLQALSLVVDGLDNLETLRPALVKLGMQHRQFGVSDRQYDAVGKALLWALQHGLGQGWNEEVKLAWAEAYGVIACIMRDEPGHRNAALSVGPR
jgi:hemoglobin-like flavoprotein